MKISDQFKEYLKSTKVIYIQDLTNCYVVKLGDVTLCDFCDYIDAKNFRDLVRKELLCAIENY